MASLDVLESMKQEAICPICLEFYKDPVTIDCGHNFCRACILHFWEPVRGKVSCPQCRSEFLQKNVRPNRFVSNIVENVMKLGLEQTPRQTPRVGLHCEEHDEKVKLFCKDEQKLICVVCSMSRNHKDHVVSPIKEAAELYQEILQKSLDSLQKQMEEICKCQSEEEADVSKLKEQADSLQKNIASKFNQLHQFLYQEEQDLKTKLEQKEKTILQQMEENLKKIAEQRVSMEQIITDLQRRLTLGEMELLQDIKFILVRSAMQFKKPAKVPADLSLGDFNGPLQYTAWKRMVKLIDPVPAPLTLDPNTAHPRLTLSDNRTRVRFGESKQQAPDKPERFMHWHSILACQGFTSGRHHWEVEVGKNTTWGVGVARGSVPRKKDFTPEPKAGVWVLWRLGEEYTTLTTPRTALPLRTKPQKLGVYLDYEAGQVSLYNAEDMSHLFTFIDTFTEKLYPFLLTGCNIDSLKLVSLQI
ncbi:E3 ubiquitin-protein ligase TRIM39-like [Heptranchias perlo]|uniref:E3 ubiquitin-protein ligase TRIM39-like n=1 Tax=Heptranchias perlo TaxID=212740 RepID=UPI0035598066